MNRFSQNDQLEVINFESLLQSIQPCILISQIKIKSYFTEIFKDLANRAERKKNQLKGVNKIVLASYLDLPMLICDKIFSKFNSSCSGLLNEEEFSSGMHSLYFGSLETMEKLTFSIFDFDSDGKLNIDDIILIFKYIESWKRLVENEEELIEDFFYGKDSMTYEEYVTKIEKNNSNVFLIFLLFLHQNKPFSEDAIENFCKEDVNMENSNNEYKLILINKDKGERTKNEEETHNFYISKELSHFLKKNYKIKTPMKRKFSSKNLPKVENIKSGTGVKELTNDLHHLRIGGISELNSKGSQVSSRKSSDGKGQVSYCGNLSELEQLTYGKGNINANNSLSSFTETESPLKYKQHGHSQSNRRNSVFSNNLNNLPEFEMNTYTNTYTSNTNNHTSSQDNQKKTKLSIFSRKSSNECQHFPESKTHSSTYISDLSQTDIFELKAYKVVSESPLQKVKLILIEKDLFCYIYSKTKEMYILDRIHTLHGLFPAICQETKIHGKYLFPFGLVNQMGNTIANINNIYFCENKEEMKTFVDVLKGRIGLRNVDNYYEICESLGHGQFGNVKLGVSKEDGEKVAIKTIEKKDLSEKEMELIRCEIDILKFLKYFRHPNIVKFYDVFEDESYIYIIMEFLDGGNLKKYLGWVDNSVEEAELKEIAKQIVESLVFLDKVGIIHRDIKPENILLSERNGDLVVKLIDFGLSKVCGRKEKTNEPYGTLVYTAPEILKKHKYDRKIDVWSFGVLLYYLSIGQIPFDGKNVSDVTNCICYSFPNLPSSLSLELRVLISHCLEKDSSLRYSIYDVKHSKWLAA